MTKRKRRESNKDKKVDKMMMTMKARMTAVRVALNWHRTTEHCATVVERKDTVHPIVHPRTEFRRKTGQSRKGCKCHKAQMSKQARRTMMQQKTTQTMTPMKGKDEHTGAVCNCKDFRCMNMCNCIKPNRRQIRLTWATVCAQTKVTT